MVLKIGITLGLATLVSGLRLYTSIWLIKKFEWEDREYSGVFVDARVNFDHTLKPLSALILLAYLAAVAYNVLNLLSMSQGPKT